MKYRQKSNVLWILFLIFGYCFQGLALFVNFTGFLRLLVIVAGFVVLWGIWLALDEHRVFTVTEDGIRQTCPVRRTVFLPWEEIRDIGLGVDKYRYYRAKTIVVQLYFSDRELTDTERLKINDRNLPKQGRIIRIQYVRNRKADRFYAHLSQCCPGPLPETLFARKNPVVLSHTLREKNEAGLWEYKTSVTKPGKFQRALEYFYQPRPY